MPTLALRRRTRDGKFQVQSNVATSHKFRISFRRSHRILAGGGRRRLDLRFGTTGFDYKTMSIPNGLLEQTEQCLRNIESTLHEAEATFQDVVRVLYILPNASEFEQCWPLLRKQTSATCGRPPP
jgi:hypothetical protein